MPPDPPFDAERLAHEVRAFAAEWLGPASTRTLADHDHAALVLARRRRGLSLDDAVLEVVHTLARSDAEIAEEFLSFFLADLARLGHGSLSPGLRRFLDTGDLVQSVVGDLWPDLLDLEFLGRDPFLALLASRLRWKAGDRARAMRRDRRREDLRVASPEAVEQAATSTPSPATELVAAEEWEEAVLALARLPERERRLLRGHLAGRTWAELGTEVGLQPESARKAVQRALQQIRSRPGPRR